MSSLNPSNNHKPLTSAEKVVLIIVGVVAFFIACPMAFLLILAGSWSFWTNDTVSSSTSGIGLFISQIWPYIVVGLGIIALLVIGAKILKKQEKKSTPKVADPAKIEPESAAAPAIASDANMAKPAKSSNRPVLITIFLIIVALLFSPYLIIMGMLFMVWGQQNQLVLILIGVFVLLLAILISHLRKKNK